VGNFFTTSRPNVVSVGREQNQCESECGCGNLLTCNRGAHAQMHQRRTSLTCALQAYHSI